MSRVLLNPLPEPIVAAQRRARASGMAHNNIALQLTHMVAIDCTILKMTKAGGNPIDHATLGHKPLDSSARIVHSFNCFGR